MRSVAPIPRLLRGPVHGPDYTKPLRTQAAGRSPEQAHRLRIRCIIGKRALWDGRVWRRAIGCTVGIAAGQSMLLRTAIIHHAWLMALIPLLTLLASLATGISSDISSQLSSIELSRN
ncbi:MAG TPA: hypothetical protein VH518_19670 [Tepidisphaeraceae bacterium]|jgi:hypothetical protein